MLLIDARDVVEAVLDPTLLVRTGVLLVPAAQAGDGANIAARLAIDSVDLVAWKLARLEPGRRYLGLNREALVGDLDAIVKQEHVTGCVMVYNADVLLARLSEPDRDWVWSFLLDSFKRRLHGLILLMPASATHIFPLTQRRRWEAVGRLFEVRSNGREGGRR